MQRKIFKKEPLLIIWIAMCSTSNAAYFVRSDSFFELNFEVNVQGKMSPGGQMPLRSTFDDLNATVSHVFVDKRLTRSMVIVSSKGQKLIQINDQNSRFSSYLTIGEGSDLLDAKYLSGHFVVLLRSASGTYEVWRVSKDGHLRDRIRSTLFEDFSLFKEFPNTQWGTEAWDSVADQAVMPWLHQAEGSTRKKNWGFSQLGTPLGVANAKDRSWAILTHYTEDKCTFKISYKDTTIEVSLDKLPDSIYQDHMGTYFQYPDGVRYVSRGSAEITFWKGRLVCGSLD